MNALPQFSSQASGPRLDNRRIAAGVVDLAVVGLVAAVLRAAAGGEFTAGLVVVTIAWALFYYFVSESTWSQTLGKRLLGLRVERSGGGAADERAVALRTVLRLVDGIAFYLVGLLVMLRTGERRQRLGDIVGDTRIVDAREPSSAHRQVDAQGARRHRGRGRGGRGGRAAPRGAPEQLLRADRGARGAE